MKPNARGDLGVSNGSAGVQLSGGDNKVLFLSCSSSLKNECLELTIDHSI